MSTIDSGWTKWYTYESGRFSETVVYRRENPFLFHGSLGLTYLIIYAALKRFAGMALPGPIETLSSELTASTIIGYVPIGAGLFIGAWFLAGIWSRRNTREEEQFNRDTMYPPKEYWEEATDG